MASQDATSRHKTARKSAKKKEEKAPQETTTKTRTPLAAVSAVDLTFGFPGRIPTNIRHAQFIQAFVKTGELQAAALEAGYSIWWAKSGHAPALLKNYHDYMAWLQAHKAQQLARSIGIEQSQVVEEIAKVAFANDYDYHVFELIEKVYRGGKGGRRVMERGARRKEVHELSRDQLAAVEVIETPKGLKWKFRDRDQKLMELGKHLGLFNEKIIHEHRHRHLHAKIDLSEVDTKKLETLEGEFENVLGRADATK